MQHISIYNGESTFRLTEYENIKVNAAETKGKAWKENYWYSGDDLLPEGAAKCWQVTAWYKWNYVGYISVYGSKGNAFEENASSDWIDAAFQDATFYVAMYPEYYALYTDRTLPK